ncbi:hypothetical protein GCM10010988_25030 [Cnuibacter physcomitrellae]|uniref:Uncharacterized protein n=1 Tax=Cnuibacter physcomitrellae TaxID=1619308 RepID=A0A1X9LH41_9MICO|nr:hypothetical protein [Cnuibacter physcomitrellae]ARJ03842.1 hypothetical protein B5808_00285 [Cnuibacter physcomitrellae]GGI39630.1 hypothetical protein GCM10010988_25030 [Cnuibacter physcomitrellae]
MTPFWNKRAEPTTESVMVHLNARLQPEHRGQIFEDPLAELLETRSPQSVVTGAGTVVNPEGGQESCDIFVDLAGDIDSSIRTITEFLESAGAPVGSFVERGSRRIPFGSYRGLALRVDVTGLAPELFQEYDMNDFIGTLKAQLPEKAALQSWWNGPHGTTFYFYGPDIDALQESLSRAPSLSPLARDSRVEVIA